MKKPNRLKLSNIIKHIKTVTRHRALVCRHCFRAGIYLQGLTHDLSKFSPEEFWVSCLMYQGTRSPNEAERELKGYSSAWIHHKGVNKHHFEHWTDYNPVTKKVEPVKMPIEYVIEMFCDRVAASKVYMGKNYNDNSPLEYFERAKGRRVIHPETSDLLEKLLIMLAEEGEDYTFAYIRRHMKNLKRLYRKRSNTQSQT